MAAVPIYVWNGSAWQETGPTIPANPIKYQASAPSSPSTGDIWVDSDGDVTTGSQQFQRFRFVASGGETTISGADANGAVLAYTAGLEQVVLNGAVLVRGFDYTATNGTTISGLSPALVANDVLEVFSFIAFTVANTYTQSQVDGLIAAANAQPGMKLIVPTSATNGTVGASGVVTFTGQSSVSLNGVFSSAYTNYRVNISITDYSAGAGLNLRFRTSGTDNTSSGYSWASRFNYSYNSGYFGSAGNPGTSVEIGMQEIDAKGAASVLEIFEPFSSNRTMMNFAFNTIYRTGNGGCMYTNTTSFDGFTIYPASGTSTGTIRVYGYKD